MIDRRIGYRVSLLILVAFAFVLSLLAGCHGEETPVSPNEKTAAPARLPGENPKAPPSRILAPGSK